MWKLELERRIKRLRLRKKKNEDFERERGWRRIIVKSTTKRSLKCDMIGCEFAKSTGKWLGK